MSTTTESNEVVLVFETRPARGWRSWRALPVVLSLIASHGAVVAVAVVIAR
jgi:hypothetical protein